MSQLNSGVLLLVNSRLRSNEEIADRYYRGMLAKDIRHTNLLTLLEEHGGAIVDLGRATGISANFLSQLKNRTREIGDAVARKIEAAVGREPGWMDVLHGSPAPGLRAMPFLEGLDPQTVEVVLALLAELKRLAAPDKGK